MLGPTSGGDPVSEAAVTIAAQNLAAKRLSGRRHDRNIDRNTSHYLDCTEHDGLFSAAALVQKRDIRP